MKKGLVLLGMLLLLVTGCTTSTKEQKMVCTRTTNMNGMEMSFNYEVYYKGSDVTKVKTKEQITTDQIDTLNQYKDQVESLYSNFDNIKQYKYDVSIDGNTLTSTTDINYETMDINELIKIDSSIEQLLNDNKKVDFDKITHVYEQTGATCKTE